MARKNISGAWSVNFDISSLWGDAMKTFGLAVREYQIGVLRRAQDDLAKPKASGFNLPADVAIELDEIVGRISMIIKRMEDQPELEGTAPGYPTSIQGVLDDARAKLMRAVTEHNFNIAKDYALCIESAMQSVSMAATTCGCPTDCFDDAAAFAHRAHGVSTQPEFGDLMLSAVDSFNSGLKALDACSHRAEES